VNWRIPTALDRNALRAKYGKWNGWLEDGWSKVAVRVGYGIIALSCRV
jgi:hypothetical protein